MKEPMLKTKINSENYKNENYKNENYKKTKEKDETKECFMCLNDVESSEDKIICYKCNQIIHLKCHLSWVEENKKKGNTLIQERRIERKVKSKCSYCQNVGCLKVTTFCCCFPFIKHNYDL